MTSWLKVSCVVLGSALALSAVDAVAAPATHSSPAQNGLAASSPIIVMPDRVTSSPIIVMPDRLAKSPIIVMPDRVTSSPIIVMPDRLAS